MNAVSESPKTRRSKTSTKSFTIASKSRSMYSIQSSRLTHPIPCWPLAPNCHPRRISSPALGNQHKPSIAVPCRGQDNNAKNVIRRRQAHSLQAPQPSSPSHPKAREVQYKGDGKQWIDACIPHNVVRLGCNLRGGPPRGR